MRASYPLRRLVFFLCNLTTGRLQNNALCAFPSVVPNHNKSHVTMTPHYRNDSTLGYKDTVDSTAAAQTHAEGRDSSSSGRSRLSDAAVTTAISTEPVLEQHGPDAVRTAATASTTSTSAPRKSRVNLACKRCKRRKQRVSDAPHRRSAITEILMLYLPV